MHLASVGGGSPGEGRRTAQRDAQASGGGASPAGDVSGLPAAAPAPRKGLPSGLEKTPKSPCSLRPDPAKYRVDNPLTDPSPMGRFPPRPGPPRRASLLRPTPSLPGASTPSPLAAHARQPKPPPRQPGLSMVRQPTGQPLVASPLVRDAIGRWHAFTGTARRMHGGATYAPTPCSVTAGG